LSRVLLEMLVVPQLLQVPAFRENRRFVSAFTRAATCLCAEPDQSSLCLPSQFHILKQNTTVTDLQNFLTSRWLGNTLLV
jgi:hypothetical protein